MLDQTADQTRVSYPELAAIVGTRFIGGVGVGLLLSAFVGQNKRRALGWSLLGIGLATTVPLAVDVLGRKVYGRSLFNDMIARIDAQSAQMHH